MINVIFLIGGSIKVIHFELPGVDDTILPSASVFDLTNADVRRAKVGHDLFHQGEYNEEHESSVKHSKDEGTLYVEPESLDLPEARVSHWPKEWAYNWHTSPLYWSTFYCRQWWDASGVMHLICLQGYKSDSAPCPAWGRDDFRLSEITARYNSDNNQVDITVSYQRGILNATESVGPALDVVRFEGYQHFVRNVWYSDTHTIENWVTTSFPERSYDLRHEILGIVDKQFTEAYPMFGLQSNELEYKACLNAVDQLDSKINWYENIEELCNIFETVKSVESIQKKLVNTRERLTQLFTKLREGNGKSLKAAAGTASAAYLTKKYGIDNDIRDVMALPEYRRYLDWASRSKILLHGRSGPCRVRLQCQPYLSGVQHIDSLGITPSLENLWEIIPFSFAADWFIDTGDALHQIHQAYKWGSDSFHIFNYMVSYLYDEELDVKAALNFGGITAKIMGYVRRRDYERTIDAVIPDACYVNKSKGPTIGSHIIETASLIIGTCSKL